MEKSKLKKRRILQNSKNIFLLRNQDNLPRKDQELDTFTSAMFRPISNLGHRISVKTNKEFIRNKVVRPASILNPAEKLKLYNKENKELFGPLLESSKERKQRQRKSGKYRQ